MQSSPLTDSLQRPLRDLRISVTDKCNLRCAYCMPEESFGRNYAFLRREQLLTFEETVRLVRVFVSLGARKIRLTGGEPLLRRDLHVLIQMIRAVPGVEDLALTTNGILLPGLAQGLKDAGLDRLTVSLDSIDDATFRAVTGNRAAVSAVLAGIEAAQAAGFSPIKINAVLQRGVNCGAAVALATRFRHTGHIVRFIEYMDVGTCNAWNPDHVVSSREVRDRIGAIHPLEAMDENYFGEVATRYRYADGAGEIGFVSSVSEPFCAACTRARLSADGTLYTCLFAHTGTDLRRSLRDGASDEDLEALIAGVWRNRSDRYSEERNVKGHTQPANRVEMYHIGG